MEHQISTCIAGKQDLEQTTTACFAIASRTTRENYYMQGKKLYKRPFGGKTGEKLKCAWQ
jgi:hypothetical protein